LHGAGVLPKKKLLVGRERRLGRKELRAGEAVGSREERTIERRERAGRSAIL